MRQHLRVIPSQYHLPHPARAARRLRDALSCPRLHSCHDTAVRLSSILSRGHLPRRRGIGHIILCSRGVRRHRKDWTSQSGRHKPRRRHRQGRTTRDQRSRWRQRARDGGGAAPRRDAPRAQGGPDAGKRHRRRTRVEQQRTEEVGVRHTGSTGRRWNGSQNEQECCGAEGHRVARRFELACDVCGGGSLASTRRLSSGVTPTNALVDGGRHDQVCQGI